MIIKEKIIFWSLLPVLVATFAIGSYTQEKKKESPDEFLKDIEAVTEKARSKKKPGKRETVDLETVKTEGTLDDYSGILERNIFFRPVSEVKLVDKGEVIALKKEEPIRPAFSYKGRMMVGSNLIVIIEDQNTGKSISIKEGDTTGDLSIVAIGEKEIRLKKKDGEEIVLSTIKEAKKEEKEEEKNISKEEKK